MTDAHKHADLIERYLAYLEGEAEEPDLSKLPPNAREQLDHQFEILRNDHAVLRQLPELAEDPVFAALGFDRAGSDVEIDGKKLRAARQRAQLDYNEIADRMNNAGSHLGVRDLFRLEQATATPLPAVDATALVAALRISLADVESTDVQVSRMRQFLASEVFNTVVRRWCDETGADFTNSARRAHDELLRTNFRGGDRAEFADLASLLRVVLESWTDGDHQKPR